MPDSICHQAENEICEPPNGR